MILKTDLWNALKHSPQLSFPKTDSLSDSPYTHRQWELLETEARGYKETDLQTPMEDFFVFFKNGTRKEHSYFQKRKYLMVFSLLLLKEPANPTYIKNLEEVIWNICNDLYWSLSAHFMDMDGTPLCISEHENLLDLFSCETGFALAEVLCLHSTKLDRQLCSLAKSQLKKRILTPYLDMQTMHRFELMPNNWSSVCSCAVGAVALYMEEDSETLTNILMRVLDGLQVYLSSFGDDGICMEGVSYWTYGFGFFVCFADLLKHRTNSSCDLFKTEKVKQIAFSGSQYYLSGEHVISFSDSPAVSRFRVGLACRLAQEYPEIQLPPSAHVASVMDDTCFRFCLSLRDFLWYDEKTLSSSRPCTSAYFPDAQWFISRTGQLQLAAKGGHNDESHNHNDAGSFLLFKYGENYLSDVGAGLYDRDYFSDKRYENFSASARSHNIPLINEKLQTEGAAHRAQHVLASCGDEADMFTADLTACYDDSSLDSYTRTLHIDKCTGAVTLEDHFSFHTPGTVTENFVSGCPVELIHGTALIKGNVYTFRLAFDPALFEAETFDVTYKDHNRRNRTAHILQLKSASPACDIKAVIRMY